MLHKCSTVALPEDQKPNNISHDHISPLADWSLHTCNWTHELKPAAKLSFYDGHEVYYASRVATIVQVQQVQSV